MSSFASAPSYRLLPDTLPLDVDDVAAVACGKAWLTVSPEIESRLAAARWVVERSVAEQLPIYGLTTGLGAGVDTTLDADDLVAFQNRVPLARSVAVGDSVPREAVRAMMVARACGLAAGGSGVSSIVLTRLIDAINAGFHPVIPRHGSLGAADLAQLAQMTRALMGDGRVEWQGHVLDAGEALARAGLVPLELGPRDGHALVAANSFSVGQACLRLADIGRLLDWSCLAAALNCEGFRANTNAFDERAMAARPAFGQRQAASRLLAHLRGGELMAEGAARKLQDPLSYRCLPQILGAVMHALDEAREATRIELASGGDNPVILADEALVLPNGNFDTTAFTLSWARLALAIAQSANATAHRIMKLMSPHDSGLPRFLTPLGQSRTGFATVQKTVSMLEAEIRHFAAPMPMSAIPVADGVEDHASLAPSTLANVAEVVERMRWLVSIELVVSAQAVDLRSASNALGHGTRKALAFVREHVAALHEDRPHNCDFETINRLITKQISPTADLDP
ncbi:HAL/PAL/TAL family ammonia-lyase [Salinicola peritrichatus]|uniref:HAL/PAL/TAL family ammonia-lyase n=1 Tax=Salinicola peritrichatus TaxID=1267424 RepID=UPI000DA1E604|nr:aromatic amino acid ammonia-lyase [Salinicola peritrichatus]